MDLDYYYLFEEYVVRDGVEVTSARYRVMVGGLTAAVGNAYDRRKSGAISNYAWERRFDPPPPDLPVGPELPPQAEADTPVVVGGL